MKKVDVVGAVIWNAAGQVLCALRVDRQPAAWEFPGGKIEPGEEPEAALRREILEELSCAIEVGGPVEDTTYDYPELTVRLRTYHARITSGDPVAIEHGRLTWCDVKDLDSLDWAPADLPAVQRLMKGK